MSMERTSPMLRSRSWSTRRRAGLAGMALLSTAAAVALVNAPGAGAATAGCTVAYTVQNQWPGGFTAAITITHLGSAVNGWTLAVDFPAAGHPAPAPRVRQQARRPDQRAGTPAGRQPLRRRVRVRAGQRDLGRPDGRRIGRRHRDLEGRRGAGAAERGLLARPVER